MHCTSVTMELCNDGRISSTLWIRLRRVTPTACRGQGWPYEGDVIWKIKVARKKEAYFDTGGILGGGHCIDVILHLHHLLDDGHDSGVHLVTRAVQLSRGLQTKTFVSPSLFWLWSWNRKCFFLVYLGDNSRHWRFFRRRPWKSENGAQCSFTRIQNTMDCV